MTQLWLVGKLIPNEDYTKWNTWEVQGIFDTEEAAKAVCSTPCHFVGPLFLNEVLPDESTEWPGAYSPKQNDIK